MPTYQYACTACGHRFEEVQAFTDPSLTECPECAGKLRKVYGSIGVVFKGSGFYRTDARTGSSTAASDKPAAEKSSDKPAAKADSTSSAATPAASSSAATSSSGSSTATSSSTTKAAS